MLDVKTLLIKALARFAKIDACWLRASSKAIPVVSNNTDVVFDATSCGVYNGTNFEVTSNNRILVKKTCVCIGMVTFGFSAITSTSSLKVVNLARNSINTGIVGCAGHPTAWDSVSGVGMTTLYAGDVLHFSGRSNSGSATISTAHGIILCIG